MGFKTPVTPAGLRQYDHLPPEKAVFLAWSRPGNHEDAHRRARGVVEDVMPVLARALRRLAAEELSR